MGEKIADEPKCEVQQVKEEMGHGIAVIFGCIVASGGILAL
jgi:hypothetical protein